jgi:hypothetical protein
MTRIGVHQDDQVIGIARVFEIRVLALLTFRKDSG